MDSVVALVSLCIFIFLIFFFCVVPFQLFQCVSIENDKILWIQDENRCAAVKRAKKNGVFVIVMWLDEKKNCDINDIKAARNKKWKGKKTTYCLTISFYFFTFFIVFNRTHEQHANQTSKRNIQKKKINKMQSKIYQLNHFMNFSFHFVFAFESKSISAHE